MQLPSIFPPDDLLEKVEGVETGLRRSNRISSFGRLGVVVSAVQVAIVILTSEWWQNLETFDWNLLVGNWVLIVSVLVLAFFILLALWSRFWLKELRAPFRYTLSVSAFQPLANTADTEEKMAWLEHDLLKRLYERITRLSLLDEDRIQPPDATNGVANVSHVHISGHYVVRKSIEGRWLIEVMPRVRIGGADQPEALAHVERFFLDYERPHQHDGGTIGTEETNKRDEAPSADDSNQPPKLNERQYERVIERVYSSVATEIYRQIRRDVQRKIDLLPSKHFKFAAYFYEAEDYAHSNTIDAYTEAGELYSDAMSLYPQMARVGSRPESNLYRITSPLRLVVKRFTQHTRNEIMISKAEIGYARMLIYRQLLAGLSGRQTNPIFEARRVVEQAVSRLEQLPAHVPERNESLFNAYVVLAYAYARLGAIRTANPFLDRAKRLDPARAETDTIYLYVKGTVESRRASMLPYFRRAVELDPKFELAQFELALAGEMIWRSEQSLEPTLGEIVIDDYERVLKLNPGNIGAWANIGYIHWLSNNLKRASDAFEYGRDYKEIRPETIVAELDYGLARLAVENGNFELAHEHYVRAASAQFDQGIWVHDYAPGSYYYFAYINLPILKRFQTYRDDCEALLQRDSQSLSPQITREVHAFVLNDYGEACMNYYFRTRDEHMRREAKEVFVKAVEQVPEFTLALYNLARLAWWDSHYEEAEQYLEWVRQLEPYWTTGMTFSVQVQIRRIRELPGLIKKTQDEIEEKQKEKRNLQKGAQEPTRLEKRTSPAPLPIGEGGTAHQPDTSVVETPETLRAKASRLEREINDLTAKKLHLERLLKVKRETIIRPVQSLLPHEFFWRDGTALIDVSGRHVGELLDCDSIRWETDLNELHVQALLQWTSFLQERTEDIATIKTALLLYKHIIEHYYPEDFVTLRNMEDVIDGLLERRKEWPKEESIAEKELHDLRLDCRQRLRDIISDWLVADPGNLNLVDWLYNKSIFDSTDKMQLWQQKQQALFKALNVRDLAGAVQLAVVYKLVNLEREIASNPSSADEDGATIVDEEAVQALIHSIRERALHQCKQIAASLADDECISDFVLRIPPAWLPRYLQEIASFLWRQRERELFMIFLGKFADHLDEQSTDWRDSLIRYLIEDIETKEGYVFLKSWLMTERQRGIETDHPAIVEDATSAQMRLVRSDYPQIEIGDHAQSYSMYPLVTPIVLEAEALLFPEGDAWSEGHVLFTDYLPDMRQRIKLKTAINVPGVRIWANDTDYQPGEYQLIVHEVPLVGGTVYPERRYYPNYQSSFPQLQPDAQQPIAAYNPATGEDDGAWILQRDVIDDEKHESWDYFEFSARHLEVVVEKNILKFFDWQQYENMLADWSQQDEKNYLLLMHVLSDREAKLKLFQAWRRLLYEQVYIPGMETVMALFEKLSPRHTDVIDLVEAMRLEVREHLPGNEGSRIMIPLSGAFETEIAASINEDRLFAIEPELAQDLLTSIRTHLQRHEDDAELAVVVRDTEIRPYVRRLLELEYPTVPVLSYPELIGNFETFDMPVPYATETGNDEDVTNDDLTHTDSNTGPVENAN